MTGALQGLWGRLVALGRRLLGWVTRVATTVIATARHMAHRLRVVADQATSGIRDRHAHRLEHDHRYRPALAAGLTAALSVLAPHPAVAAGLAVLVAEHLAITDDEPDYGSDHDVHGDYDRYQAPRRPWTPPRSTPPSSQRPIWDGYDT